MGLDVGKQASDLADFGVRVGKRDYHGWLNMEYPGGYS